MINEHLIELLLAGILVSNTYDKKEPFIKWGGTIAGVVTVVLTLFLGKI